MNVRSEFGLELKVDDNFESLERLYRLCGTGIT